MKLFSFICAAVACIGFVNAHYSIDVVIKKSSGWGTHKVCTITSESKLTFYGFTERLRKECLKFEYEEVGEWSIKSGLLYNTATGIFSDQVLTISSSDFNYVPGSISSQISYGPLVKKATLVVSFDCMDGTFSYEECHCIFKKGHKKGHKNGHKNGHRSGHRGRKNRQIGGKGDTKFVDPVYKLDKRDNDRRKGNNIKVNTPAPNYGFDENGNFVNKAYPKKKEHNKPRKQNKSNKHNKSNKVEITETKITCKCDCNSYEHYVQYYSWFQYFDWSSHYLDYKKVYDCDKHHNCKIFFKCRGDKKCIDFFEKCHKHRNCVPQFPKRFFDHCSKKGRCHEIFGYDKHHKYIGGYSVIVKSCKKRCSCEKYKTKFTYKTVYDFSWNYFIFG